MIKLSFFTELYMIDKIIMEVIGKNITKNRKFRENIELSIVAISNTLKA